MASGPEAVAEARDQYATINQPPPPGGKSLDIQVSGQQFLWRYQYPNQAVSFHEMVVPRDTTVTLTLKANDVIHSWWIPELGGKLDARARLHEQDLVQGDRDRHVQGPVRRAVRQRPLRDDGEGDGRRAGALQGLGRDAEAGDRRRRAEARARSSARQIEAELSQ